MQAIEGGALFQLALKLFQHDVNAVISARSQLENTAHANRHVRTLF